MTGVLARQGFSGWTARFAVQIQAAVNLSERRGFSELAPMERAAAAHREMVGYLARLAAAPDGCAFEIRWRLGAGGPRLFVLGRAGGATQDQATAVATDARALAMELPPQAIGEALTSADDVEAAFRLFPVHRDGIAEIRRPYHFGTPQRIDAGVRYYVAVTPFASGPLGWPELIAGLSSTRQELAISIGLVPTVAPFGLDAALGEIAARYEHLAQPTVLRAGALYSGRTELAPDPFAVWASGVFRAAQQRCRGPLLRTRISVASARPLDPGQVSWVARLVDGQAAYPRTEVERAIAVEALDALAVPTWGTPELPVPEQVRLLTELADPAQAAAVAWLPVAAAGPFGWFPTVDPRPGDRPSKGDLNVYGTVHGDVAQQKNEFRS
ncbi:MAG TPA: hypothetical protein VM677_10490 [Actinokineospora sp.]|nr:hypothetical protein [Actinokineospora sp.]